MTLHRLDHSAKGLFRLSAHQWWAAGALILSYLLAMQLSELLVPNLAVLFPASAIALAVLFLAGIELWPAVFIAAFIGNMLLGSSLPFLLIMPVAQTLQAVIGAFLLRNAKVDPLFRRSRDIFFLLGTVVLVSAIVPTFGSFANAVYETVNATVRAATPWSMWYIATVFSLLILVPFILRWFAKPRFSRTLPELAETLTIFGLLIGIDVALFLYDITIVGGIPLVYFLLVPLFWIALRLRPRFVTLAMLLTSGFAIASLYVGAPIEDPAAFNAQLFQLQTFLIALASMFYIIVSLEEDRRLHTNLMRSQVATLENAVSRISSESKAKNDFITVLAHELRNPLAPVVSAIDLLKLKHTEDPEDAETLTMMEDRMQTVRRLLDDLLDIARISEGKVALKKEPTDLEAVLRRAIISSDHHLSERHQSLSFKSPKHSVTIEGDPVRLEQIFSNLLTNASKYSDPGDTIALAVKAEGTTVEVSVCDSGVGIEADALEDIFTPFHQIELGARSRKGLGIGLSLVRSFSEMHGGTVTASSKGKGQGSVFTVTLPRMEPHQSPTTRKEPKQQLVSASVSNGLRVLVVDDNDAAAWGIGKLLELRGCSVSYAYDGRQAIEEAENVKPDVILLDLGLPDQDGYSVGKTIRARGYRGRLVALTGFSTEESKERGKEVGFEHYLVKPAGFSELKRAIPEIA